MAEDNKTLSIDDKENKNKKGVMQNYNNIAVTQRDYYYDAYNTDGEIRKDFGDMFFDLKQVNMRLKKELSSGSPVKLDIGKDDKKMEK